MERGVEGPGWRRTLSVGLFAVLVATAVDPLLVAVLLTDRAPLRQAMLMVPDAEWYPAYPRFLAAVRDHTRRGDTIAILVPAAGWDRGYSRAYYRASYLLAGREVLPVIAEDDRPADRNLQRAAYVAAWHVTVDPAGRRPVFTAAGGTLLGPR